jgi:hypothetical protein
VGAVVAGDVFLNALRVGGSRLGLGDYRPEKSGPFGRFTSSRWPSSGTRASA